MAERAVFARLAPDRRIRLATRMAVMGALLVAEKYALDTLVDARRAETAEGLGAFLRHAQHWGFRFLVTFIATSTVLAIVRAQQAQEVHEAVSRLPAVRRIWLLMHVLLVAALAPLSYFLYRGEPSPFGMAAIAGTWVLLCAASVVAAGAALAPPTLWLRLIRSLGVGWIYAASVALLATGAWVGSEKLWSSAAALTFQLVQMLLTPVLRDMNADPATRIIATPHFAVEISEVCSGLEGLGLTLAFSAMWLLYFRREYIFPRALILIPLSLLAIFAMNAVRIAALLLIGNAGYPDVASFGFHSQAGWIAFNAVACAVVFFSRRSPWLNRATTANTSADVNNPTATYLIPLLAILAAGTLSHALSGRFETLYPLRLFAVVVTLYVLRRSLLALAWRCTWRGPAVGAGVFLLWAEAAHWLLPAAAVPEPLTAMLPLQRDLWVASRCLMSVAFVPIAEELAYRGYLMRRLTHPEFETVPYRSVGWGALIVTAALFAAPHGAMWVPALIVGVAYGRLSIRTDSLGEAAAAHATTNGLIAVAVVAGNQWQFW